MREEKVNREMCSGHPCNKTYIWKGAGPEKRRGKALWIEATAYSKAEKGTGLESCWNIHKTGRHDKDW